ncbi:lytic transglycosylase domain-containing protein [Labrys wisconsinensis]|uniref:Soluble lytic murein transglycosylase n=1 Tax=Labrys wisconsinensis TaxID=425677 RepID=A0ABU0J938_9HYPH|nr:lytic transglycosylase domain-containing protein [Labrys wisconsinensis]MDQ0470779.1 soluble lytic murein transglycosylase [Labrys wisconsinensis]
MLLRILSGSSLYALILTAAVAAPLAPVGDGTRPPPPVIAVRNSDITGSIGSTVPSAPSAQLAMLKAAIAAYKRGDLSGGDASARSISDPAARATAEWIAIRTAPRQIGYARIARFLTSLPNWPSARSVRARGEEALYNDNIDDGTVRASFAAQAPQTDEGKVALARVLLKAGDRAGATALIRDAYRNDSLSGGLEGDIIKNFSALLTRADMKYRVDRMIYDGNAVEGLRAAQRAGAEMTALAKARIAVAKKAGNAGALLAAVPASLRSDPAYLFARISYLRRNDKAKEAAALLLKAPRGAEALVRPDEWWTERRLVARDLLDKGDIRTAYAVASGYTAESDQTGMEAEFHCGWIALRFIGDAKTAARHFAKVSEIATRPISLARGAYWQGRAAEALGDKAGAGRFYAAAARYSTTYYGQIARAKLGFSSLDLKPLPEITAGTRAAFNSLLAPRAISMLYDLGERDFARILVGDMAGRLQDTEQLALLGSLVARNDDSKALLSIGKSATQRGLPLDAIAFPTDAIPSYRSVADVERAVVYSIARQESEFSHDVVSHAGARGLMQLMPSTARATAKSAGLAFDASRLTRDPAYNAQIGSAHLGELIGKFNGSYIMAFAAYNAGSSRVAQWVGTYGDPRDPRIDPIDWVERIPFTETRNYVQRVMENVQVYRARLGAKSALLIEKDLRRGTIR